MNTCRKLKSCHRYDGTIALIILLLMFLLIPTGPATAAEANPFAKMGVFQLKDRPDAPEFILTDLNGKKRNLGEFKGRFVMLNFWATW